MQEKAGNLTNLGKKSSSIFCNPVSRFSLILTEIDFNQNLVLYRMQVVLGR